MINSLYIAGQITGLDPTEAAQLFEAAEILLKEQFPWATIVNPFKLEHDHAKTWEAYMCEDLVNAIPCDAIYMLENWKNSKGAQFERMVMVKLKKVVIYQGNEQ